MMKHIKTFEAVSNQDDDIITDLEDIFIDVVQDDDFNISVENRSGIGRTPSSILIIIELIKGGNTFKLSQEMIDCIIRSGEYIKVKGYSVDFKYKTTDEYTAIRWKNFWYVDDVLKNYNYEIMEVGMGVKGLMLLYNG